MSHISFREFVKLLEEKETFVPTAAVAKEAQQALDWRDEHEDEVDAGTRTGWIRANQLAKREEISFETVKRMKSFFARHKGNEKISNEHKDEPWKDNGHVAWKMWGGDSGKKWAEKIVKEKESS